MNTTPPMPQNRTASPAKPPRKPFSPDMDLLNLGVRVADKIINTRNLERLRPYLNDANATDDASRKNGVTVLLGVAMRGAAILERIESNGMARFSGASLPSVDDLVYAFKTDPNKFVRLANQITDALARTMEALPGLKIEAPRTAATKQDDTLKVEITALPDRVTTTAITRDESGNIASSAQLERDV